jgi:tRNA(Ile)-lysidine synthase
VTNEGALRTAVRRCLAELPEGKGVVAVSGGPDSVALLRALLVETRRPLVVAHLNHRLRGEDSDDDEAYVRQLCQDLVAAGANLVCYTDRRDVCALADGDNLESAGRRLRYGWLAQVAHETAAAWVATGHTADDQAETVLHRLLRGTGLRGLAGIPRRRNLDSAIVLVRPLLAVRRTEVLAFLEHLGQRYREDASNLDPHFTRNRLRHELLPLLTREYNPAVVDILNRLAEQAGEVHELIADHAAALLAAAELPRAGKMVVLDVRKLASAPPLLAREALHLLWQRENWPLGEMGFEAWQRALAVAVGEGAADFPGGVRLRRVGHVVQIAACGPPP